MKKIGITGQNGFVGSHLYNKLQIQKDEFKLVEFRHDFFDNQRKLQEFVSQCDVIVHLAAINRHDDHDVLYNTNVNLVVKIRDTLISLGITPHVIFASSTQEERNNSYGNSKQKGREILADWAKQYNAVFTGLIIPNVFGPLGKPFYNSVTSTFCYQISNNQSPTIINDSQLDLIYIDDLTEAIASIILKNENNNKKFIQPSFKSTVSEILKKLNYLKENGINYQSANDFDIKLLRTLNSYMNTYKVLILGSSGMAGHMIFSYLKENTNHHIYDISYRQKINDKTIILDVTNVTKLEKKLREIRPDYIINAVGVLVKEANKNPTKAIFLNSYLPHFLLKLSKDIKFKIIHLSTDCIFSGKEGGYKENSFKDANDFYGRSKTLGEIDDNSHITLRTSIIGPEIKQKGNGLLHWFLKNTDSISGYKFAFWSGVTTLQLAKVTRHVIQNDLRGLHHVTNNTKISKYDLLNKFNRIWEKGLKISVNEKYKVDKSFVDTKKEIEIEIPNYDSMLLELNSYMKIKNSDYKEIYKR